MEQLLEAAAAVFAEAGYEAATTNAIAARAGVSPGTLYQFFANKEAIAEALAVRYLETMHAAYEEAFAGDLTSLPLDELVERLLGPVVHCSADQPAFHQMIGDAGDPARVARSKQLLQEALVARVEELLAGRAPHLPAPRRHRTAEVSVQLVKGMLPLVEGTRGEEQAAVMAELKRALRGYLAPVLEEGGVGGDA